MDVAVALMLAGLWLAVMCREVAWSRGPFR